jgi:DNA adenine methylase
MLKQIIRDNDLDNCDYVEPFAGGAGAAITLLLSGIVNTVYLNDLDYAIYSFWKAILDHTDEFIAMIRSKRISIAEWKRQREICYSGSKDVLTRGFSTFFLNRCNRAGILTANPIGGLTQRSQYSIKARFKKPVLIEKIRAIAAKRNQINLSNLDACRFLCELKTNNPKTLVYFDPPYYQKGGLLYMNAFTPEDHIALSECILNCSYAWILSYDNRKEIRALYKGINTYQRGLRYTVSTPSIGMELIFSNLIMPDSLTLLHGVNHAG